MSNENNHSETKPTSAGTTQKPDSIIRPAPLGNIHTHSLNNGVSTPESAKNIKGGK